MNPYSDEELREIWRHAGGRFHGPNVETGTMPEEKLLPFLRKLLTAGRPSDSSDFVKRTSEDYVAWCQLFYSPEALDPRGMMSLHGLWAWQEQERRKAAALAAAGAAAPGAATPPPAAPR